jgi:hypothetical protein
MLLRSANAPLLGFVGAPCYIRGGCYAPGSKIRIQSLLSIGRGRTAMTFGTFLTMSTRSCYEYVRNAMWFCTVPIWLTQVLLELTGVVIKSMYTASFLVYV